MQNDEINLSLHMSQPAEPSRNKLQVKKTPKKAKDEESNEEDQDGSRVTRSKRPRNNLTKTTTYIEPSRKSARLSAQSSISYDENDDNSRRRGRRNLEDEDGGSKQDLYVMPKLKKLRNPSPPTEPVDHQTEVYADAPSPPKRQSNGNIIFENNNRHFMPNVTPKEMIQGGIFGGTAFRPFYSRILKQQLDPQEEMDEFPNDWFEGITNKDERLTSTIYEAEVNRFGVKAGQTLEEWESNNWIRAPDYRGWWQWYFRFYQGRRTSDDARQIGRWLKACGPAGRFKRSLVAKIHRAGATWDDETITPVVRQTLFHWAYQLTEQDYHAYLP